MKAALRAKKLAYRVISITLSLAILLTYQFLYFPQNAFAAATDVNLTSDKFTVNDVSGIISNVSYEDSDSTVFLDNLKIPEGATYELIGDIENDQKGGITGGKVVTGNEIKITSADGSNKRTYKIEINQQYNAEDQYSSLQGANNWYYKEIVGNEMKEMVWGRPGSPFGVWTGTPTYSVSWKNMVHPDIGSQPVRIFKSPKKGIISIDNNIKRLLADGKGVQAKVMKNDQVVWPETGEWVQVDTTLITTSSAIEVNANDEIKFVLDNNGIAAPNTTYWRMVVTYLPQAQEPTAVDLQGDGYIRVPVTGSINTKYTAAVIDQNNEVIPGEAITWSISPEVPGVTVTQDGIVTVSNAAAPGSINLVAASVNNPSLTNVRNILLKSASEKIDNDEVNKLLLLNSSNVSMLIDYNNKAKIISLKVNDIETLDSNGIISSVEVPRGTPSIGTDAIAASPAVAINGDVVTLNGITYSNSNVSIDETWTFTVNNEDIQWGIKKKYTALSGASVDVEQKSAGFTFKKDIFDTAFRSDGGSQVLLSPTNRSRILAFDPLDKQYGTTEAGMAFAGGGIDLVNVPNNFILSLQSTSDKNIVSEFYRDPFTLQLKYDNKLNAQDFTHKLYRPDYDLGFHTFMPSRGEHSYDPVTVSNQDEYEQNYSIKASTSLDKYYSIGNLPASSGIDQYKFGRFLSEFGRTSIVDLDGIGGSWNALRLEFSDTMAGQYAVKIMNGMQYTENNSKTVKALKALVESAIVTQKENGHMVGCPEISGQAYNYPNVSEADAAVPMDAAAYINATRDVAWANEVKDGIRKALDYRLSKDANNNGLVENEIDNNYGRDMQAWLDVLYIGGEDAYVNALMYSALTEWADIEEKVLNDAAKAAYYREKAQKLKETYNKNVQDGGLWSDSYQSFVGWRFLDGSIKADVKYIHVSATAIANGVASKERAQEFLFGAFDGYANLDDWMTKNGAKAYPLNLQSLDKTETVERFLNEWPGWENGQIFPQTTGDMMAAYAKLGSTIPVKYMKNLIDLYFTSGDPMYFDDTFTWDFGSNTFNCNTRMAINVYSAATLITDIFGFKPRFDGLEVNPVIDSSLYGSEINYHMRGHKYTVRFDNDKTRTMLVNDGAEKVTFKWNNLVAGTEYTVTDKDNTAGTENQYKVVADADGIASYVLPDNKERSITIAGDTDIPAQKQDQFKATAGYSDVQGANGWSYSEINNTQSLPLQWNAAARQWQNAEKDVVVSTRIMKATADKQAVRSYESPKNGKVNIYGNIRLQDMADKGAGVKIMKNGEQWWPKSGEQVINNNPGIGFNGIMNVAAGDKIDFVVSGADTVIWSPVVEYISDPNAAEKAEVTTMPTFVKDKYEFNSSDAFGFLQGNDNWFYEEYVSGAYKPMHWSTQFNAWQGSETYALIDSKMVHPGTGSDTARIFKAPDSGTINILGNIKMGTGSINGIKVKIVKNDETVYPQGEDWKLLDSNTPSIDTNITLDVEKGDRIAFIVNSNGNNSSDTTFWTPTVKYLSKLKSKFDSKAEFSNEQGKDNWYYREIINGTTKDMTWVPNYLNWTDTWKGTKDFALIFAGEIMHPDTGNQTARVFKVPRPGYISINGKAFKNVGGDGTKIKVMKNEQQIWPESDWSYVSDLNGVDVTINKLAVEAGDEIAFVLDCNGTTENDGTTWAPVIEYIGSKPANQVPVDDATLKGIVINNGVLSPEFSPSTTAYTVNVKYNIANIEIAANPTSPMARTRILTKTGESTTGIINLDEGSNLITIEVTSENGEVKKEYTLTVNREYENTFNGWDGFSSQQGQNNWYYKEIVKDSNGNDKYNNMVWGDPIVPGWFVWQGSKTMVLMFQDDTAKTIIMHPEKDIQTARIFKAPINGTIDISNKITKAAGGNGTKVQIRKNGVKIWPIDSDWKVITGTEAVFGNVQIDVKQDDEIQFVLDCNGPDGTPDGISNDGTGWLPVITYLKVVSVEVAGNTDLVIPNQGETTSNYTAAAKYHNGTVSQNPAVSWAINPPVQGVSVDENGMVTVSSSTTATSFMLTANINGVVKSVEVNLTKEQAPEVASVEVTGKTNLVIPIQGDTTSNYTAIAKYENGEVAENPAINWAITPPVQGVSVDSAGKVTVSSSTTSASFVLTASINGVSNNIEVKLTKEIVEPTPTPTPTPTPEIVVLPNGGVVILPDSTVDKATNTVLSKIPLANLKVALEKSQVGIDGAKRVTIEVKEIKGTFNYVQEIPLKDLMTKGTNVSLEIATPVGTVDLTNDKLKELGINESNTLKISVSSIQTGENAKPAVNVNVNAGDKAWSDIKLPIKVTVDYKPSNAELKDSEHIIVLNIDSNGNTKAIPNGKYDSKTGKVAFTVSNGGTYTVAFVKKTFDDLDKTPWAKKSIEVLASRDIISGVSITEFHPVENITRADFLLLLVKTLGLTAEFENGFDDVKPENYYYDALGIAKQLGISTGTGDNKFNPTEKISRQDMMVMVAKALQVANKKMEGGEVIDLQKFSDSGNISSYAIESIAALVKDGIIEGSGNLINPKGNATRAEVAVIMYKLLNK